MTANRKVQGAIFSAALLLTGALAGPLSATPQPAPPGNAIEQFGAHAPDGSVVIRHRSWGAILRTIFNKPNAYGERTINYGALDEQGRKALDRYIDFLQGVDVSELGKDEQLAFWLNLYNAASLDRTVDEFVRMSSERSRPGAGGSRKAQKLRVKKFYLGDESPWTAASLTVGGVALSLNDIEHKILYAHWDNPLIMYSLTCPAKGCPGIPMEPFTGGNVQAQLSSAATKFMADKDNLSVSGNKAELSQLYEWHAARLGGEAGIINHLKQYSGQSVENVREIDDYDFSWRLNGTPPKGDFNMPKGPMTRGVASEAVGGRVN